MKLNSVLFLAFILFGISLNAQTNNQLWVSAHYGYQKTENDFQNAMIDKFWNVFFQGEKFERWEGDFVSNISIGGSFIPALPQLGFQIGLEFWQMEASAQKYVEANGFWDRVDYTLHLGQKHFVSSFAVDYSLKPIPKFEFKPGLGFLLNSGELVAYSEGLQGTYTVDEEAETVYWKGTSVGVSFFIESNYSISERLDLSLMLRYYLFEEPTISPSNENSILTLDNHLSSFNNSGFGALLGLKYYILK